MCWVPGNHPFLPCTRTEGLKEFVAIGCVISLCEHILKNHSDFPVASKIYVLVSFGS